MPLNHEKLRVYQDALQFNVKVGLWVDGWGDRHAMCDQLARAAGSVVENIAFASASYTGDTFRCMEYAIGSVLECTACIDLAVIKGLINRTQQHAEKKNLFRLHNMMQALRRSWSDPFRGVKEPGSDYVVQENFLFPHEKLQVYQCAITLAEGLAKSREVNDLSRTKYRRLDDPATSVVLNIAEGTGRFTEAEKRRFFEISLESGVKLAARLDIYTVQGIVPAKDSGHWKSMIERIAAMLTVMIDSPRRQNCSSMLTSVLTTDCSGEVSS